MMDAANHKLKKVTATRNPTPSTIPQKEKALQAAAPLLQIRPGSVWFFEPRITNPSSQSTKHLPAERLELVQQITNKMAAMKNGARNRTTPVDLCRAAN